MSIVRALDKSCFACAGLAVVWDMLLTSHFVTLVMLTVWRIPTPLAVFFYSIFAVIEGLYFSSSVEKIPKGRLSVT